MYASAHSDRSPPTQAASNDGPGSTGRFGGTFAVFVSAQTATLFGRIFPDAQKECRAKSWGQRLDAGYLYHPGRSAPKLPPFGAAGFFARVRVRCVFAAIAPGSRTCRAPARCHGTIPRQDHQSNASMPFKQSIRCNLSQVSDPEQTLDHDAIDDQSPPRFDNSSAQSGASDRLIRFPLGRRPSRSEENTIRHRR